MKPKTLLVFSIIILLKNLQPVFAQDISQKIPIKNLPVYVRELQQGPPPEDLKYTDPKQYEFLLKRRAILTGLLKKEVHDKKLPEEALEVLKNQSTSTNNFSINQNVPSSETSEMNFHLVKDINQATNSNPSNDQETYTSSYAVLNNCVYYQADDGIHGIELWRSDGTAAGTYIVKDIVEGLASSNPADITAFQNKIYFSAYTPETGYQLYQSDGTADGTILFKNIISTQDSGSRPRHLTVVNNKLYFVANTSFNDYQLWKIIGTTGNTTMIKHFHVSTFFDAVTQLTAVGNTLFFSAYTADYGAELWKSDGTHNGTLMVKDINTFNDNSFYNGPGNLTALNGRLYFSEGNGYLSLRYIWVSDGTDTGTKEIKNNNVSITYSYTDYALNSFAVAQKTLFFVAAPSNDYSNYQLYKYDPSKNDGIQLVIYITDADRSNFNTENLRSMNGNIYFVLPDASTKNFHLWKSDGTAANTKVIKYFSGEFNNKSFYVIDSTLYFSEYTSNTDFEPWTSDGTTAGTKLLKNISDSSGSFPTYFTACNGSVFFSAYKTGSGRELWLTKGNADNTTRVKDIKKTASESALVYPAYYDTLNSKDLIFTATTPETGNELWKSDGTAAGTVIIKDLYPNEGSSDPIIYEVKNGKVYFGAYDYSTGSEGLFVTDGTSEGTKKLAVVEDNNGSSDARYLSGVSVADNGVVFFRIFYENIFTGEYGYELWRTDSSGLYYNLPADPGEFSTAGNTCIFEGYSSSYGQELWVSDGTVQNTHQLIDINPGINGSYPSHFMSLNNKIIFAASNGDSSFLYTTDGTISGTIKIGDIIPSAQYAYMGNSAVFKGKLYFAGFAGPSFGNELCSTDGTESGTKLVADINPGSNSSFLSTYPCYFTVADTTLYFIANDGVHGNELWKLSGKTFKTNLVKDITPGNKSSNLFDLTALNATLYFQNDSANITTPWQTNGSPNSTQIVTDPIFNDSNYESAGFIISIGNKLFLGATNHQYGDELYVGEPAANKSLYVNDVTAKAFSKTKLSAQVANNPFYSDLKINITSPQKQQLIITIINASGQQISNRIIDGNAGTNDVTFNSAQWQNGIYIINVSSKTEAVSLKAIK